ncbi:MAG: PleD family two-component system response regulator [Hyphomicrobiaceae bacterium]
MSTARILVVDDDRFSRLLVVSKAAAELGAEVLEADNGASAFSLLSREPVDLVILDLEMPGMNGFELLGCIRVHPRLQHLPVVVLTGKDNKESLDRALMAGATSFLTKPLNWACFGKHIGHILHLAIAGRAPSPTEGSRTATA